MGTAMYIIPPLTYHDAHIAGSQLGEICNTILYARREKTIFTARNQLFPQFLLRDGGHMICKAAKNDNGLGEYLDKRKWGGDMSGRLLVARHRPWGQKQ